VRLLNLVEVVLQCLHLAFEERDLLRLEDIVHLSSFSLDVDEFLSKAIDFLGQTLVGHIQLIELLQLLLLVSTCFLVELQFQLELTDPQLTLVELRLHRLQLLRCIDPLSSQLFGFRLSLGNSFLQDQVSLGEVLP
jgi:hypothetical protein